MALLSLNGVSLTFAGPPLLDAVSLQIDDGERGLEQIHGHPYSMLTGFSGKVRLSKES